MNPLQTLDDWEILLGLPAGWAEKASELGALARKRKIDSPQTLLRVLLIHLADGKSLRTTAAYSQEVQLCNVNDVSLLHRLRASESWFRWMSQRIAKDLEAPSFRILGRKFRVRIVDGTAISEPEAREAIGGFTTASSCLICDATPSPSPAREWVKTFRSTPLKKETF